MKEAMDAANEAGNMSASISQLRRDQELGERVSLLEQAPLEPARR